MPVRLSILQPEAKADDLLLARGQCVQYFLQLFAHHGVGRHLRRCRRVLILDSVLDDTLKLNAVQIFKHAGERMGCEIELRTV